MPDFVLLPRRLEELHSCLKPNDKRVLANQRHLGLSRIVEVVQVDGIQSQVLPGFFQLVRQVCRMHAVHLPDDVGIRDRPSGF